MKQPFDERSTMSKVSPIVFAVGDSLGTALQLVIRRAGYTWRSHATMESFLASQRPLAPSCLLLEIGHPDLARFDLVRRATAERRDTPVIVTAIRGDVSMSVQAMKAGAIEFFIKPVSDEDLLTAIAQGVACSRALLEEEAELFALRRRYVTLSRRERDVMSRVVAGRLNKQIGVALGISEITVKAHRGKMMRKMRAESLAALVSMSIRLQLPQPPSSTVPALTAVGVDASTWSLTAAVI
jgi:FixJ family two-component response regulator